MFLMFVLLVITAVAFRYPTVSSRATTILNKAISTTKLNQRIGMSNSIPATNIDTVDINYNLTGANTNRSVYVVPRRAYLDNRIVDGKPRNTVVIIAEVHFGAEDSIVACLLDGRRSVAVNVIVEHSFTGWVKSHHRECTHRLVVIECKGYPEHTTANGSSTGLIYMKKGENLYSRVITERPLLIKNKAPSSTPARGKGSIFTCCTLFGRPERFHDWLRYQKTLGVDFVHLNVDVSFASKALANYPFLNESIHNGFVEMDIWNDIAGRRMFYHGQITKYQDCVYRYIGEFEFGIFLDTDDFFNPLLPDHKDIHYYLSAEFANPHAGSICFPWRHMRCSLVEELHRTLVNGNLTSILGGNEMELSVTAKCAHRLSAALFVKIHDVERYLPGYHQIKSHENLAYVAHNSIYRKRC